MKKNRCKWLSLFAAAVLLVTTLAVSPFFATAEDDGWTVTKKATEYSDISSAAEFQQTDAGIPAYDGVLGYRFSKGSKQTGWVVYDAGTTVNTFKVGAILGDPSSTAMLTFDVSADGSSWTAVEATATQVDAEGRPGWPTFDYTAKTAAFRYLRVNFVDTKWNFDPLICNIYMKNDAAEEKEERTYDITLLPTQATAESEGTLQKVEGDYYAFVKDGARVEGTLIWKLPDELRSFSMEALVSDVDWGGKINVHFSVDTKSWKKPSLTKEVVSAHPNPGWGASYIDQYCVPKKQTFRYVRITFKPDGGIVNFPAIRAIRVTTASSARPESYKNTVAPDKMTIDAADGAVVGVESENIAAGYYTIRDAAGTRINGSLTVKADGPIVNYNFHTVDCAWAGKTEFYASKDGQNWELLFPATVQGAKAGGTAWGETYQCEHYGSLSKADGYLYLRVSYETSTMPFPAIGNIEYNAEAAGLDLQPVTTNKVTPDQMHLEAADADAVLNAETENDFVKSYFTIRSADKSKLVNGSLTFMTNEAIEKYVFATIESDTWNGNWKFYASKDGKTWDMLSPEVTKGEKTPVGGWGPCYQRDNRGTLDKADDYRYLRASIETEGNAVPFPAIAYAEFNVKPAPAKPTNFNNMILPTNMTLTSDTKGAVINAETQDIAGGCYTIRNADGSALVNGSLTLKAKAPIESYNFATVESDVWNGNWRFYASKDGQTWVELTPTIAKGKQAGIQPAWGPCYQRDNYGTLDKADGYLYLRATVTTGGTGVPFPSLGRVEYYAEGLPDGVVEEKPDIADLELPSSETDFTTLMKKGVFKLYDVVLSTNNAQAEFFGAPNAAIVMTAGECGIDMYTPNVRDFKFIVAPTKTADKLQVRAYGRQTQYGEETEIMLMRTGNIRTEQGERLYPWYQYRVADRANMAQDYQYIRITITGAQWSNIHSFTYFYDGPEPGDVPDDERAEPEDKIGTEREGVMTINANKGNLGFVGQTNMGIVANGDNAAYIGAKAGIVIFPKAEEDADATFATEGISKFWVKFVIGSKAQADNLKARFFVAPAADAAEDEWTEISAHIAPCTDKVQPTGWTAIEYVMDDGQQIPAGSNVLKVFIPAEENKNAEGQYLGTSCQIARVDYEWSLPDVEPLPDMSKPDAAKGEQEMLEDFSGTQLEEKNGGKAYEAAGVEWMMMDLGSENGKDKVYYRESNEEEAYLIYHLKDIASIDVRGYRAADIEEDLLIYVSADGEEWVPLEKFTRKEAKLYGGPVSFAHLIDKADIPAGMSFVKIEYPELASPLDIVISDIHVLYGSNTNGDSGRTDDPKTGVALPLAGMAVALLAGAGVVIGRKRRED